MVALMQSFDKKGEVMIGILGSMNETLKGVNGDTGKMLEKQAMMLEKQDETIDAIDRSKEEIVTKLFVSPFENELPQVTNEMIVAYLLWNTREYVRYSIANLRAHISNHHKRNTK